VDRAAERAGRHLCNRAEAFDRRPAQAELGRGTRAEVNWIVDHSVLTVMEKPYLTAIVCAISSCHVEVICMVSEIPE